MSIEIGSGGAGGSSYTHPASHPASMITETETRKWVSPAEKSGWDGKQDALSEVSDVPGLATALAGKQDKFPIIRDGLIGTPGAVGFGVGICPEDDLPTGFVPLMGYTDPTSGNYGNYQFSDGSIMVFVPKFYYRINHASNPTNSAYTPNDIDIVGVDTYATTALANADGYALHRAFIDGGEEKSGFFVDKYQCSKNVSGAGYIASSLKDGLPISTASTHNPITDLTACTGNYYYECVTAPHARDGYNGAVNSDSIFFCKTQFIQSALALLSLAHGQASSATTNCAWYGASNNYPKGCNDNALKDTDDTSVIYVSDGYSNCGKTGSGVAFAKTTHNGQNCGVADLNGLMWEISIGFTRPGTSATDTTQQNDTSAFYALKQTIEARTLTGGFSTATDDYDAWGDATHLATLYDATTISHIDNSSGWTYFGNGSNQVLSGATSGADWLLTGLGFPKDGDATSAAGTDLFGEDGFYKYHRANLCVLSCDSWGDAARAGVFALSLSGYRSNSSNYVGFRAACYPV